MVTTESAVLLNQSKEWSRSAQSWLKLYLLELSLGNSYVVHVIANIHFNQLMWFI